MIYTIPDYYKQFVCTADQCEDTCCAGWQIVVDRKSMIRYGKEKGPFRKKLRRSVNWMESTFRQSVDKRCAFLNEENLCDMYTALGRDSLCKTCRLYPRHIEEFEGVREITLSVSCPEVAKMLMSRQEPVQYVSYEKEGEEEFEEYDPFLYSVLADARDVMLRILQNRSLSISTRIVTVYGLAHDMQRRIDQGQLFSCEELYDRYESQAAYAFADKKAEQFGETNHRYEKSQMLMGSLDALERLRADWDYLLWESKDLLYEEGGDMYNSTLLEFQKWCEEEMPQMEILLEQLMVYFVFTYFCGAVYDGEAFDKIHLAAASTWIIYELWVARWLKNEKQLDIEDLSDLVYRFSRELEHSDENIDIFCHMSRKFYTKFTI